MFPVLAEQKFCISLWDSHKVKIKRTKKTASSLNDFKVYPFQVFPAPKGVSDLQYFCQIVPAEGKTLMYRPLVSLQTLPQVQEPLGIPLWANQPDQPVWDEQENYFTWSWSSPPSSSSSPPSLSGRCWWPRWWTTTCWPGPSWPIPPPLLRLFCQHASAIKNPQNWKKDSHYKIISNLFQNITNTMVFLHCLLFF